MTAARVEPQPDTDPGDADPMAGQRPLRDECPPQEGQQDQRQDQQNEQGLPVPHDRSPARAARTSGISADRAEPTFRSTSGASSEQIRLTIAGSIPARSPW